MSTQIGLDVASLPIAYFQPSSWGDYFVNIPLLDEASKGMMEEEIDQLKKEVKTELLAIANKPTKQLEFIDSIERLGVAYHFEKEIEDFLQLAYHTYEEHTAEDDLYHVALRFRILRQHGFYVLSDVFKTFKDENGNFMSSLQDVKSILSLYEASYVGVSEDLILDEAAAYTSAYLNSISNMMGDSPLAQQVAHALLQPLHRGIIRLESKHYISFYEQNPSHNKTLLKLAKLDFNLLQSLHHKELRDLVCWWKGLHSKLPYSRDRSVECYFWALGCYYEHHFSLARKIFTRLFMVTQVLDDTYDAFGTLRSLELLTEAVKRWDYSCVSELPDHFKCCYQVLLETFDEVGQELAMEGTTFSMHYIIQQMKENCEAWFQEAKWCYQKYIPTFEEYMEVSLISIAHVVGIVASFLGMGNIATQEAFEWVCRKPMPKLVQASDVILRLMNDIGGHKFEQSRDHVASSVQCYMEQHGITNEQQVYEELEKKVEKAWKDVNQSILQPFIVAKPLVARILNFTRVADVMYKGRIDGYTMLHDIIKNKIASVLIDPVTM